MRIMLMVALLRRTNTPLWICLKRRSCMIFLGLGASLLILRNKKVRLIKYYLPSNTDNESNFSFGFNEEVSCGFGGSSLVDEILIGLSVFNNICCGLFGSCGSADGAVGLGLGGLGFTGFSECLISLGLFANAFGDCSCPKQETLR
jgi:hypothetical protein